MSSNSFQTVNKYVNKCVKKEIARQYYTIYKISDRQY